MNQLLHIDDIEILDKIISECLKNGIVRAENLKPLKEGFLEDVKEIKESRYLRYFSIIQQFDIAEVTLNLDSAYVRPKEVETARFFRDGGFKNLYEKQQKEIEIKNRQEEKELNEAVLSKWHKKTYWWTFGIAIAGFILAVLALFISIKHK